MMWLYRLTYRHFYWSLALLKKFFKLVPIPTISVVVFTLVSQFSRMLAFFLPLKVIILIGSTGVPRYFPDSWANFGQDYLVVALSFATVLFYLFFLLSERLIRVMSRKGAQEVVERSRKMILFSNQDQVASQAYQKLSAGLSTGVLAGLLGMLSALFYPAFLGVMVAIVMAASALVSLTIYWKPALKVRLQESSKQLIELLSGVVFLLLFAFMVADFLLWEGAGFMVAIISLLLSRQLLNRLESVIKDALWLYSKRLQINAIFFAGHKLVRDADSLTQRKLWGLLSLHETPARLLPLIEGAYGSPLPADSAVTCRWRQSGLMDILAFDAELNIPGSNSRSYLLKVFGSQHKKAALNEADLLFSDSARELPALPLMLVDQLDGCDVHIFLQSENVKGVSLHQNERFCRCWQMEPGKELIIRYRRSHPFLHQRLSASMLLRLKAATTTSTMRAHVEELQLRFDELLAEVDNLPLAVLNLSIPSELSFTAENGELQIAHWGSWALEPVGANFPLGKSWREELEQALESAAARRDTLRDIPLDRVQLCVCLSHFEMRFSRQKYLDAIALIPVMLGCFNGLDSISEEAKSAVPGSADSTAGGAVDS